MAKKEPEQFEGLLANDLALSQEPPRDSTLTGGGGKPINRST